MSATEAAEKWKPHLTWRHSAKWGACLLAAYVGLALGTMLLAISARPESEASLWTELGLGAALSGFALLSLQAVLASRLRWMEEPFGLDAVMQFHKGMAVLAVALLLAHPVLLSLGQGNWRLFSLDTSWQVVLGKLALVILVFGAGYAVLVRVWRLEYQRWRRSHNLMIAVVVLGFVHGLLVGHDLEAPALRIYWSALLAVAVLLFAWRNLAPASWRGRRCRVREVRQAGPDAWSLQFEPTDGKPLPPRNPGEFMFLKLNRPGRPSEEHPFTISASPTEPEHLAATIKESGDFTRTIGQTRPGDAARIEGPFGRFSYVHHKPQKLLFVAGGVGITPIRSMLRCLADSSDDRPAALIYGNKTEADILFRDELEGLPSSVRVTHVLSKAEASWDGPRGYVTKDILVEYAGDFLEDADIYLCGPPPMVDGVLKALRDRDVAPDRIHFERFSL